MVSLGSDAFTGTNGAAWAAPWTTGTTPTGGSVQIQTNRGRMTTGSATGYAFGSRVSRRYGTTSTTNAVIKVKFRHVGTEAFPHVRVRTDSAMVGSDGYAVFIDPPSNRWKLFKSVGFADTDLGTGFMAMTFTANTDYWVQMGAVGTSIKAKVWQDGSAEPGWAVEVTDSSLSTGFYGMAVHPGNAGGNYIEWDDFSADTAFPTTSAFTGSVALSGDGQLAGTGTPNPRGSCALSGDGQLAFTALPAIPGSAALSSSGALTFMALVATSGSTALAGSGQLTGTGVITPAQALPLSGSGTLSGTATITASGTVALSGSGSLTGTGVSQTPSAAQFTGDGQLTLSGAAVAVGSVALSGSGDLSLVPVPKFVGTLPLGGSGTLAPGTAVPAIRTSVDFTGSGTLFGSAFVATAGSVAFSGSGQASNSANPTFIQQVGLTGTGSLVSAAQAVAVRSVVALTGTGELTFVAPRVGELNLSGGSRLTLKGKGTSNQATGRARGWGTLIAVYEEAKFMLEEDLREPELACPHDGEPLLTGPHGELYCRFDGYRGELVK